jgi:hypothetical protein
MCHKAWSVPTPNISSRPSVLHAAADAELRATWDVNAMFSSKLE